MNTYKKSRRLSCARCRRSFRTPNGLDTHACKGGGGDRWPAWAKGHKIHTPSRTRQKIGRPPPVPTVGGLRQYKVYDLSDEEAERVLGYVRATNLDAAERKAIRQFKLDPVDAQYISVVLDRRW